MNYLDQNPDFLKRFENAVDLPAKETGNGSVDYLTVGLYLLIFAGGIAVAYKMLNPQNIVINHYYPPNQSGSMVQSVANKIIPTQNTVA